ncbi:hypothetical protein O181_078923 [Austropuccinia psidii MF-1]|uniref:Copia protein n=1 Tax=Austropuccinia psidii MF-1 TaxID=1389203 RepID=A0A9Q3FFQ6_9BASI|nr:hypothetical protein [Austropuccinia psidii MF-1]
MYGKGIISWRSKKLGVVSSSSTEAEFQSYLASCHEENWLDLLKSEVSNEYIQKIKIYSDNQGAISRAKNPIYHSRTKHIEVHYNSIRDSIEKNEVMLEYLPTNELIADCLTKALDQNKLEHFKKKKGLQREIDSLAKVAINIDGLPQSRGRVERAIFKSQQETKLIEELIY